LGRERDGDEDPLDESISSFLVRESVRRVEGRSSAVDVAARIRARQRTTLPFRTVLVGIAAVAIASVLAALVLLQQPSTFVGSSPAPQAPPPALRLPAVGDGQACPVSKPSSSQPRGSAVLLGSGPVTLSLAESDGSVFFESDRGLAISVLWTANPAFSGTALVRGTRLDGAGQVHFGDPFDPAGSLQLEPTNVIAASLGGRMLLSQLPIRISGPGCYGLQIDTMGFSATVILQARPIEDAFAALERPLTLPRPVGVTCPVTPGNHGVTFVGGVVGVGPVYVSGGGGRAIWIADPTELGPILVRGARIDGAGELRFGDGTESAAELRLPIKSYESTEGQPIGWRIFNTYGVNPSSSGCYAMQVDTLSGSSWIVLKLIRTP
jgi:hypothetical protein